MKIDLAGLAMVAVLAAGCAEGNEGGTGSVPLPTTAGMITGVTSLGSSGEPGDSDASTSEGSVSGEAPTTSGAAPTTEPSDPSEPLGVCGDGNVDPGEACDGESLVGSTCMTEGFAAGKLVCSPECELFTGGCYSCGDGIVAEAEACDGVDFKGKSCTSLGYGGGNLVCAADCKSVDTGGCVPLATCGNGIKEGNEQCDGGQLGGQTCEGLGYDLGALACSAACTFNAAGCMTLDCAGQGEFCLFDENDIQSNCCPPGVKGNVGGYCHLLLCI